MANVSFEKPGVSGQESIGSAVRVENHTVETPVAGVTIDVTTTSSASTVRIPTPASTAVEVVPPVAAPVARSNSPVEFDDENLGFEDVILPRINIVQKVGDLSNIFNGGEIVLNQQIVIHTPANKEKSVAGTGPLNITILGFRPRQFVEKVEGGKMGILANSEADVVKHGGTLDYKEWKASLKAALEPGSPVKALRYFQRLATAVLLIERPESLAASDTDHILFPYECAGRFYALALWGMKGVAYTGGAKVIFTARKLGHLRHGYCKQAYTLTSKLEDYDGNFAYKPILGVGAKTSPEFETFIRNEILDAGH